MWVGNDDNSEMKRVTGGSLPAMIWKETMEMAHEGLEPVALPLSQSPVARGYDPRGSFGSFFGSLFGFEGRAGPQDPRDPRLRGDPRFGRNQDPRGGWPPRAGFPPQAGGPFGGQQVDQQRTQGFLSNRSRRDREERPQLRLRLGGRPVQQ